MNSLLLPDYQFFSLTTLGQFCIIVFCLILIKFGSVAAANLEFNLKEKGIIRKSIHTVHCKSDYTKFWAAIFLVCSLLTVLFYIDYMSRNQVYILKDELSSAKTIISYDKLAETSVSSSDLENYFNRAYSCINANCRFSPENSIVLSEYLLMSEQEKLKYNSSQLDQINSNIAKVKAELSKLASRAVDSEKELKSSIDYTSRTFKDNSFFENQLLSAIRYLEPMKFSSIASAETKYSMLLKIISMEETQLSLGFKQKAINLLNSNLAELKSMKQIQ